jgi:adenine-specific DNA methylase
MGQTRHPMRTWKIFWSKGSHRLKHKKLKKGCSCGCHRIKGIITQKYKQLYAQDFNNINEIDHILERYKLENSISISVYLHLLENLIYSFKTSSNKMSRPRWWRKPAKDTTWKENYTALLPITNRNIKDPQQM